MLAQRFPAAHVHAVELEPDAACQAKENAARSPFCDRISVHHRAIQGWGGSVDLAVCNPPFFHGRPKSPDRKRNLARHDDALPLPSLFSSVKACLRSDGIRNGLSRRPSERTRSRGGGQRFHLWAKVTLQATHAHDVIRSLWSWRLESCQHPRREAWHLEGSAGQDVVEQHCLPDSLRSIEGFWISSPARDAVCRLGRPKGLSSSTSSSSAKSVTISEFSRSIVHTDAQFKKSIFSFVFSFEPAEFHEFILFLAIVRADSSLPSQKKMCTSFLMFTSSQNHSAKPRRRADAVEEHSFLNCSMEFQSWSLTFSAIIMACCCTLVVLLHSISNTS